MAAVDAPAAPDARGGLAAAFSAYAMWGLLPLYLKALAFANAWEILGQRILWCVPAAGLAMAMTGGFRATVKAVSAPGVAASLSISAFFIAANWTIFVFAVMESRVIEASLAYFLAPLVNVAIGVTFFGERLKRWQGAALAVASVGVVLQGVAIGAPPWMALGLTATWAVYTVVRKQAPVPAGGGLFVETMILAPFAFGLLIWLSGQGPTAFLTGSHETLMLMLAGPVTALPLMLFAFGARRVSFITLGLLQFIAPSLQLLTGLAFGESFTPLRAASFALIWIGLGLFMAAAARGRSKR